MRIRIEATSGELESRAHNLISTIEKMVGCDCLHKADEEPKPKRLKLKALQESIDGAGENMEKIHAAMLRRINAVLARAI